MIATDDARIAVGERWTRPVPKYRSTTDRRSSSESRAGVSGIDEHLSLSLLTSDYELSRLDNSRLPSRSASTGSGSGRGSPHNRFHHRLTA